VTDSIVGRNFPASAAAHTVKRPVEACSSGRLPVGWKVKVV
jgi:hypothetical protein